MFMWLGGSHVGKMALATSNTGLMAAMKYVSTAGGAGAEGGSVGGGALA